MKKYFIGQTLVLYIFMYSSCTIHKKGSFTINPYFVNNSLSNDNSSNQDAKSVDVNLVNESGNTPLHQASSVDRVGAMEILIKRGANINAVNKWGHTPLTRSIEHGSLNAFVLLLKNNASVNIPDKFGLTPVFHVSRSIPIRNDGKIEESNEIIIKVQMDMLKALSERGAKLNIRNNRGRTPLYYYNSAIIIKFLIDKGLDVNNIDNEGTTPLFHAVKSKNIEVIKLLLSNDAKVKVKNNKGQTVLDIARSYNKSDIFELLRKYD
jgi:ankyrin repeat protein